MSLVGSTAASLTSRILHKTIDDIYLLHGIYAPKKGSVYQRLLNSWCLRSHTGLTILTSLQYRITDVLVEINKTIHSTETLPSYYQPKNLRLHHGLRRLSLIKATVPPPSNCSSIFLNLKSGVDRHLIKLTCQEKPSGGTHAFAPSLQYAGKWHPWA